MNVAVRSCPVPPGALPPPCRDGGTQLYAGRVSAPAFVTYELLTTDLVSGRRFYEHLLGPSFWGDDVLLSALPEQARARGALPHFRGHVSVSDVEAALQAWIGRGATQLGPLRRAPAGALEVGLRDPAGAVFTLSGAPPVPSRGRVRWHSLYGSNLEAAFEPYAKIFGWVATHRQEVVADGARHRRFAWERGGQDVGSLSDLAAKPGVHPQWLFFFGVDGFDRSLALVREHGGLALPPVPFDSGRRCAACEDPQGAAFGLLEMPG